MGVDAIVQSIRTHVESLAEQKGREAAEKRDRKRVAAKVKQERKNQEGIERRELEHAAEKAKNEAGARLLKEEIRRETPIDDLQNAMLRLQSRWNER